MLPSDASHRSGVGSGTLPLPCGSSRSAAPTPSPPTRPQRSSAATDELMRELMERNELEPDAMVSCIFTLTDDLNAEFPAVAARALGLSRVPLLCAREVPVPGSLPRVIRVLVHYYAAEDHEPRHVYLGGGARSRGPTSSPPNRASPGPACRSSSPHASAGFPSTRWPPATTSAPTSRCSPPTSRASRRCPRSSRPPAGRWPAPTATRTRPTPRCGARWPTATGSRPSGSRSATARATSCSLRARRCSSRAPRSSTRGRRSACTRTWRPPRARGRSRCRSTTRTATTSTRSPTEVTVATRLVLICNPNNPTSTALGLDEIDAFLERIPSHVCVILDEAYCEFALALGDTYASLELLRKLPQPGAAADVLQGLRARRRCGSGTRCAATEDFRDRGRPGPPAVLPQRRRAGGGGRGAAPPGRGRAPRDGDDRGAARAGGRRARAGAVGRAVRRELHLAAPARDASRRPTWWPDCETAGCWSAPAPRSGGSARCA